MNKNFNSHIEDCIKAHWDKPSLTDYNGEPNYYYDMAKHIARLHIVFEQCGIKKGDKISLAGRNSSHWAISLLATLAYGAVAVPILHEFTPENMYNIINHSESKLFFVGDVVWGGLNAETEELKNLSAIVLITDFSFLYAKQDISELNANIDKIFADRYKNGVTPEDVKYHQDSEE